ncbi:MAG: DUF3320 domain-containing protein [Methanobrevibacter sp.]|nr:DUF3320 domain-containing protein [Methanobrevibacter sp.]
MQFRTPSKKDTNKDIEKEFKNLRKELLDLTLRNPLLNFKARNRNLKIINQSPINIYKTLILENKKMYFAPNKKESRKSRAHAFIDQTREFLSAESDKTLKADLSPSELQKRLFYIDQQSKTMVQEQGYNILYIAVGFIEWIDKKKPRQKNLAPLILIPVEMERKKVGNSFSLSWTGEDLQNNISIQAKLREAGIELPKFEQTSSLEGINHYLEDVRHAIRPFSKWDVKYDIALGFFSFTKFVMYNDLNPESWSEDVDLTKNELIQAIFNPSKNVYDDTFEEEDVDEKLHYKTMYQVLDADSSQIAVIENVKAGHNLVVEGPPGTGKSQTIVNLIAELIAEGKTVLFVSEKMAALEVVKSRLDSVGLGKFVLELHSHKTRRKKLLKNLQKATNVRATRDLKLDQTLRKLENLRNQLDEYAEIIHRPVATVNLSPFELYGMKESSEDYFARQSRLLPLIRFDNPDEISMKDLDDIILSLENLSELYGTISKNNPWSYCNPKSLLPADLREIEQLIRDSLESLNDFRYEMEVINEVYGIKVPDTLQEYEDSITALNLLNSDTVNLIDSSILLNREWYNNPDKALELIKLLSTYQNASGLFNKFTDYLLIADLDTLINDLNKNLNKKFRLFGGNSHKDELSRLYKDEVPSEKEALNDLIKVRKQIRIRQSFIDSEEIAVKYFGALWAKNANINELKEVAIWMRKFTYLLSNGTFNENTVKMLSNDLFHPALDSGIDDYIEKGNKFYENLKKLESKLNPRSKIIFKKESEDVPFEMWEKQLNKWKGQLSSLHLWSQYSNTKRACMNSQASMFIKTIEKRNIKKADVKPLVLGNFADSLLNIVFGENEILAGFIGELHENRIREFRDLDKKIINLNRKRIFNKLNSQIPKIFGGADDKEANILAGEFTRKSGHLPVRTLLEKAGGTIKKIKPVFMMSPLSIAQYLDPTNPKLQFDVVIFDEASQVKPEDALGAFMRGKTAVVMGDTQQLPPTSFFDQMTDSESGEEVATALDMESILHLCKLSFPVKMLKWHYRSRHESLINISNREFYDNELLVYPSPSHNDPELGLKFHYNPNTAYHRGEGSANPKEARDVVKEIFKHFEKYGDKKSLGVGTFSVAQKNAILEELEIERKAHPEFEPLFSDKREERFFVKNLETIQGDERDVILISVGYGYDTEGKMSLNFGPLNQDGGERRLNVLITRAREKCVVFTNFRAHDIHLTANPPFGVKSLQSFLEYAENLQFNQFTEEEDYDEAPFEDAIYNFLLENDYQVDKKIGCAGFRVDLAIIDEDNPGKYILGIQCDGHNYASSKVARDRDRLREQVLGGLGWNIYHIWSTDWYRNRDLARARLLENIEETITKTKVNDLKSKISAVEAMKINPVTTVVIDKKNSDDNDNQDESDSIPEEEESNPISKEKEKLINSYLKGFDEEFSDDEDNEDDGINESDDLNDLDSNHDDSDDIDNCDNLEEPNDLDSEIEDSENLNNFDDFEESNDSDSEIEDSDDLNNFDSDEEETDIHDDYELEEELETPDSEIEINEELNTSNSDEDESSSQNINIEDEFETDDSDSNNIDKEDEDNYLSDLKNLKVSNDLNDENKSINENKPKTSDKSSKSKPKYEKKPKQTKTIKPKPKKEKKPKQSKPKNKPKSKDSIRPESINENKVKKAKDKPKSKNISLINRLKNIGEGFVLTKSEDDDKNDTSNKTNEIIDKNNKTIGELEEYFNSVSNSEVELEDDEEKIESPVIDTEIETNDEYEYIEEEPETIIEEDPETENNEEYVYIEEESDVFIEEEQDDELIEDNSNENHLNDSEIIDNDESEDIESMRQDKNVSKRRYNHEIIDDSNDVIVPITAERRAESNNYSEDSDVIIPIQNQEDDYDSYPEDYKSDFDEESDELEELISENVDSKENADYYEEAAESPSNQVNKGNSHTEEDDSYYYSAVGIENPLKKNAVHYPKSNDRNKKGLVGAVSSLKDEMLYINASLKEIENPSEREKIYVIDPSEEGEYYEDDNYDSRYYHDSLSENKDILNNNQGHESDYPEETIPVENDSMDISDGDFIEVDSDYINKTREKESLFSSKKHEYLEKLEEYRKESAESDDYIDDGFISVSTEEEFIPVSDDDDDEFVHVDGEGPETITINQKTHIDDSNNLIDSVFEDSKKLSEGELESEDEIIEMDDDEFESIINDVNEDYQELEKERIQEANVLSPVDNTRLTPRGKIEDYIVPYEEIDDIIIKSASEIYDDEKKLATAVMDIVAAEGPVHTDVVIRRFRESCNLSRAGTKFKDAIFKAINRNESHMNLIRIDDFLFMDYNQIKVRKREKPNIDLISKLEIEKSIDLVLSFEKSLKVKDLAKMVSRTFGFRSTSKKTSNKIIEVIDEMIGKEILINTNDKIEFR